MKFHMLMFMNAWMMLVLMKCKFQLQCLTQRCYRPHLGLARSPTHCSGGLLDGPGLIPRWCLDQFWRVGGISPFIPLCISALCFLNCAFCLVFHFYLNICPAKHDSSNTSGTMSIVKAYVLKVCLFLLIWIVSSGRILSLRTANSHSSSDAWHRLSRMHARVGR